MTGQVPFLGPKAEARFDWLALTRALEAGHSLPRADSKDSFLYRGDDTILSRAAMIDGLGALVKTATIWPGNAAKGLPTINGAVSLFSNDDGRLAAMLDFALVTKWKTAGDSLLGALRLARPDSRRILIIGAGTVAASLVQAYGAGFPDARIACWSRTDATARDFAAHHGIAHAADLPTAVAEADIVTCATMTTQPVLRGDWLRPGQHIDLIGAYRPDMREADNTALTRAAIFVDSRETTLDHIGELKIPLAEGVITRDAVVADHYDGPEAMRRTADDEITLFKNGGGAHLDLMTARYMLDAAG